MGIVYIIECLETGEVYIGSTMRSLEDRYAEHRRYSGHMRYSSRSIIERGNHMVRALEVVETEDRDELRMREQYWINEYDCVNQMTAYATEEEKKDQQKARGERYRKKYPDLERQRHSLYYQENKDKVNARNKRYGRENREVTRQASRRYYEKNKDKEKARKRMYKEKRSEWEATWKLDGRKIDATNLLDIDPTLFE